MTSCRLMHPWQYSSKSVVSALLLGMADNAMHQSFPNGILPSPIGFLPPSPSLIVFHAVYRLLVFHFYSSTSLLHSLRIIDQGFETRKYLSQALAEQFFGCYLCIQTWYDQILWCDILTDNVVIVLVITMLSSLCIQINFKGYNMKPHGMWLYIAQVFSLIHIYKMSATLCCSDWLKTIYHNSWKGRNLLSMFPSVMVTLRKVWEK